MKPSADDSSNPTDSHEIERFRTPRHAPLSIAAALGRYFGLGLLLHFAWEMAQMPLFALPRQTFWEPVGMCLFAAVTGDTLFMALIYAMLAVTHRHPLWIVERAAYRHPATWIQPVILGVLLAVSFELWAVHIEHRWVYGAMPLVPILHVGWTPVLQMIAVPLAVLWCSRSLNSRS